MKTVKIKIKDSAYDILQFLAKKSEVSINKLISHIIECSVVNIDRKHDDKSKKKFWKEFDRKHKK